jgi:hypothetical protein
MRTRVKGRERNGTKPRKSCHLLPPTATGQGKVGSPGDLKPRKSCHLLPPTATFWHAGSTRSTRWEHSLKRLKSQHGLALRLCKPRPMPRSSGMVFVPRRMQHRLASAEPGGTWLSRLCVAVQGGGYSSGWLNCNLLLNHAPKGMVQKRPISGNTWALSAHPERSRVRAVLGDSVVDVLKPQLRANRVYPRSSSQ